MYGKIYTKAFTPKNYTNKLQQNMYTKNLHQNIDYAYDEEWGWFK